MSMITSLKLGVVPITEEGVDRYKFSDNIELHFTQIYATNEDLNCSVGRVFTKMKVPVSWFTVMNANYLIADMDINNPAGSSLHIKGWIDSIDLISDSEDYPQVEIRWHFDYYEMYKSSVTLGYGHIKRRPFDDLSSTPIQNYQYRYLALPSDFMTTKIPLFEQYRYGDQYTMYNLWWIVVSFNVTKRITIGGVTRSVTEIQKAFIPFGVPDETADQFYTSSPYVLTQSLLSIADNNNHSASAPGYAYAMDGFLDEGLGIDPQAINGVWVVPAVTPVANISGKGTLQDPIKVTGWTVVKPNSTQYGYFTASSDDHYVKWSTPMTAFTSTEKERYIVVGYDGTKVFEIPYGMEVTAYETYVFFEANACYGLISFKDQITGKTEGMVATVIFPPLPVNSNAGSSYVYSGQQEYDREARTIQSNASAWKTSAAGGGQGAMMGAFGAPGLALGVAGGVSGGLINYGVEMLYQNDEEQRILDRLMANQTSGIIMGSDAGTTVVRSRGIFLTKLVMDSYSESQADNTRNNFGISVDEILASCETIVKTTLPTGYYSIKNLIISGNAPKEAKDYIKKKFDAGVRLL